MPWMSALWSVAGALVHAGPTGSTELITSATVLLLIATVFAVGALLRSDLADLALPDQRALDDRSHHGRTPRHRDPNAAGRPRPRAPAGPAAVD